MEEEKPGACEGGYSKVEAGESGARVGGRGRSIQAPCCTPEGDGEDVLRGKSVNLNQAKEGAETAIAFFISLVSALLEKPVDPQTIIVGEMSVKGLLRRVNSLPERLELAREAGAKRILIPSENKRDL